MKTSSAWLLKRQPLLFDPLLATKVGLNGAIFLQQLEYWLDKSPHTHDDRKWVYNTYDGWREQFPFWSINTIRRTIADLEHKGILNAGNFNKMTMDRTKWYTINYGLLDNYCEDVNPTDDEGNMGSPSAQNEQTHSPNVSRPIPETTTETTTESSVASQRAWPDPEFQPIEVTEEDDPPSSRSAPPSSPTYEDWEVLATHLGWNPKLNVGLNLKTLKSLHAAGVSAEQIIGCVEWMRADPWWGPKGVDLKKVSGRMQEYLSKSTVPGRRTMQQEYEETVRDLKEAFGDD
jgi:hypothetical protein